MRRFVFVVLLAMGLLTVHEVGADDTPDLPATVTAMQTAFAGTPAPAGTMSPLIAVSVGANTAMSIVDVSLPIGTYDVTPTCTNGAIQLVALSGDHFNVSITGPTILTVLTDTHAVAYATCDSTWNLLFKLQR